MIAYIVIAAIITITFYIIYTLNDSFSVKLEEKQKKVKLDINSDYVIILTLNNCIFCEKLEEKIKDTKVKYTNISILEDFTLKFDSAFTDMSVKERQNITNELKKIFMGDISKLVFPTIIFKNTIYNGLPDDEILAKLFGL